MKFAEFLVEPPPHFDGGKYEVTGTTVEGRSRRMPICLLAFFDVDPM